MIVCICHRVSDRDIEREARQGCGSFEALQDELHVATACGACRECAHKTFERACAGTAVVAWHGPGAAAVRHGGAAAR
jgi:bacterioferritin-associated ferredoxin